MSASSTIELSLTHPLLSMLQWQSSPPLNSKGTYDNMDSTHCHAWGFADNHLPANVEEIQTAEPITATQLPSSSDWESHRQLITDLYSTQKWALTKVMRYMANQHDFPATVNMYKKRIKRWGLDKKFKRNEAIAMLSLLSHHETTTTVPIFTIRGKEISKSDLERYARRAFISTNERYFLHPGDAYRLAPDLKCRLTPRRLQRTRSPDHLYQFETLHHALASYLHSAFDSGLCKIEKNNALVWKNSYRAIDLWGQLQFGLINHNLGKFEVAGKAWRLAFLLAEDLVTIEDPRAWLVYCHYQKQFIESKASEVGLALNKHLLSLMDVKATSIYPHRRLVTAICSIAPQHIADTPLFCWSNTFKIWESYLSPLALLNAEVDIGIWGPEYMLIQPGRTDLYSESVTWLMSKQLTQHNLQFLPKTLQDEYISLFHRRMWDEARRVTMLEYSSIFSDHRVHLMWTWRATYCSVAANNKPSHFRVSNANDEKDVRLAVRLDALYHIKSLSTAVHKAHDTPDGISNCSNTADGSPEWRIKMEATELGWVDKLVAKAADLSIQSLTELPCELVKHRLSAVASEEQKTDFNFVDQQL